jgi:hypothetical protein
VPAYALVSPLSLRQNLDAFAVEITYDPSPAIAIGVPCGINILVENTRNDAMEGEVELSMPAGWTTEPAGPQRMEVPVRGSTTLAFKVSVGMPGLLRNSNRGLLCASSLGRPAEPALPVVLAGARRWLISDPLPLDSDAADTLERAFPLEASVAGRLSPSTAEGWTIAAGLDNAVPLPAAWTGVCYARLFLHCPTAREVRLGIPGNCPRKLWVNGRPVHTVPSSSLLRPNYRGDGLSYTDSSLVAGWNDILIKYVRQSGMPAFEGHFTLATTGLFHGIHDVQWTSLPWE